MTVELRDLKWAIAAGQHRSLRRAAQTLNIEESTLSRSLRALEAELGAKLFDRTNGGTRPTPAGLQFLAEARRIISDAETMTARFRMRSAGESGRLVIGVHTSLATGNLRATLVEFRRQFPDVETHFVDGSSYQLISDLANSAIDVAFVAQGNFGWDGNHLPVWSERLIVAIPVDHPLIDRKVIQWSDLRNELLLLPERAAGPEFSGLIIGKLGCFNYRLIYHDVALDRLLTMVGAGWGILVATEGATGAHYPGVTFRELHDLEAASRLSYFAYWKDTNNNASLQAFLRMLRDRYPDLSGEFI